MNPDPILKHDSAIIELNNRQDNYSTALGLASQAHWSLLITSRELDHCIFDNTNIISAISNFASANHFSYIKILIKNSDKCTAHGHRLVALSQKYTSHIFIRQFGDKHKRYNEAFIVADHAGYLHLPLADRYQGTACFADTKKSKYLVDFFTEAWDQSELIADFRRLNI